MAEKIVKLITPVFRVSYPHVFTPQPPFRGAAPGAKPKYNLSAIFPKVLTNPMDLQLMANLRAAVNAAAVAKWGADTSKWPGSLKSPWRDGKEKQEDGYGPDVFFCSMSSERKPDIVGPTMQPIVNPNEFFGGCYARAAVHVYAYDNILKGVGIGLDSIRKERDGVPFGSVSNAKDDFDAIPAPEPLAEESLVPAGLAGAPMGAKDPFAI